MKKILYIIIFLFLLILILPVLTKNNEFNNAMSSLWNYIKEFSNWLINEIGKLIKLIEHKK